MISKNIELSLEFPNPVLYPDTDRGTVVFGQGGKPPEQPKLIHVENAIATQYGIRSLGYVVYSNALLPAIPTSNFYWTRLLRVRNGLGYEGLYFCAGDPTVGHYVFNPNTGAWVTTTTAADTGTVYYPTVANINGLCYVHKSTLGLFVFNANFTTITVQAVQGLTMTAVQGVCEALDYLVAWDVDTVYWSAPATPLDFRPIVATVETGAGSSRIQALRGTIIRCVSIPGGFIIYGTKNSISARYSGNSINPWIFTEIEGSAGLPTIGEFVGSGITTASHFAYTTAGLLEVNIDRATLILPELTTFFASNRYTVSMHNGTFSKGVATYMNPRIVLVSERYLCISYKTTTTLYYSHVIIWDLYLKSWGSMQRDHYDIFDFQAFVSTSLLSQVLSSPGDLGMWDTNGQLIVFYLSFDNKTNSGVTILPLDGELVWSDFSLTSSSQCSISGSRLGIDGGDGLAATLTAKSFVNNVPYTGSTTFTEYPANSGQFVQETPQAQSHRLQLIGAFDLASVFVEVIQRGPR